MAKKKREKTFRLFEIPRYLPGQVHKSVLVSDLTAYNKHRYNVSNIASKEGKLMFVALFMTHFVFAQQDGLQVTATLSQPVFTAQPRVDDKPLLMNPLYYVNNQRMLSDAMRLKEIERNNKELIKKINTINRMGGRVDTFNPIAYAQHSKWRAQELKMKEIAKYNVAFYDRLINTKSLYSTKDMDIFWEHVVQKLRYSCKFPIAFLEKKTLDQSLREQPSISGNGLTEGVDRPKCFMDFRVKEGVFLGRIVIELYHDYVPVTVQNFLSLCCHKNKLTYKNCQVHRAVPGEFIETGDITKGNGKGGTSIYGDTFAEENHKLKHTKAGVLSTIRVGNKVNNSQFCITLAPMEKLNGNRVVFGKVIKGNETLCRISDLGRKFGRPTVPIYIHNCGKFISGQTPAFIRNFKY